MLNYITITFPGLRDFSLEGTVVGLNYWYLLGKRKEIKFGKINIIVRDGEKQDLEVVGLNDKIVHFHLNLKMDDYQGKGLKERIKLLYELIFYVMDYLCESLDWDKNFYDNLKTEIVNKDYSFEIFLLPAKKNKEKNLSAELVVELDPSMADLRVNIYDSNNMLKSTIKVFQAFPMILFYKRLFHKSTWISNNIYSIWDTKEQIFFDCNVHEGLVNIRFEPKTNSVAELNDLLKSSKFNTPLDERLKLLESPKSL